MEGEAQHGVRMIIGVAAIGFVVSVSMMYLSWSGVIGPQWFGQGEQVASATGGAAGALVATSPEIRGYVGQWKAHFGFSA